MKLLVLTFVIVISQLSLASASVHDFYDVLTPDDQTIYLEAFHKCRTLSKWGSLWAGLDADVAQGSFTNLFSIMSFNTDAATARFQANLLSPAISRKLNSIGYRKALFDCFGDPDVSLSSNLARQGAIVGLLMSEVVGTGGFVLFVVKGGPIVAAFTKAYPWVAMGLTAAQVSVEEWRLRAEQTRIGPTINASPQSRMTSRPEAPRSSVIQDLEENDQRIKDIETKLRKLEQKTK